MTAVRYTFKKNERLKREQHIDSLFRNGKAFSVFPIKFIYQLVPRQADSAIIRTGFSVPKKKFKSSVQRHAVRRKLIEAWRVHKHLLLEHIPPEKELHIFLIFTSRENEEMNILVGKIMEGIDKLKQTLSLIDG